MITSFLQFVILCVCTQSNTAEDVGKATKICQNIAVNFSTLNFCEPNKTKLIEDVNQNLVTVCRIGKNKALIQPLNLLWLDDPKVFYSFLTNKFYITFNVQLTSSRILDEISKRPEFNNTQVAFMDVTEVRFVAASSEFFQMRTDIQLNQDWKTVCNKNSEDKFTRLEFKTSSRKTADKLRRKSMYENLLAGDIYIYKQMLRFQLKLSNDPDILESSLKLTYLCKNSIKLDIDFTNLKYPLSLTSSGIPKLYPTHPNKPWILMQRRETAGLDFNKNWADYKNGFGDWRSDFWLGLEKIYQITKDGGYGLRMEFESHKGLQRSAQWENFKVGSEEERYKLFISGFDTNSSAGGDNMVDSNGGGFATVDKDNSNSCAEYLGGGWWFHNCMYCHFNSQLRSSIASSITCVHYYGFNGNTYIKECLKRVRMFIIKH